MKRILIATIYQSEPVTVAAARLGIDKLILLVDYKPDKTQEEAIKIVKTAVGPIVEIIKTEVYDIVKIVEETTKILDDLNPEDEIYINITAGRKTKALGLLFASYLRSSKIKKIIYVTKEDKQMITLPKLSFNLTQNQIKLLQYIQKNGVTSITKLSEDTKISRSMVYNNLSELTNMGLLEEKPGIQLTDAGKIAIL